MDRIGFSVIVPAHNEEKFIGKCLAGIRRAARQAAPEKVQMIVAVDKFYYDVR